MVSTSYVVHRLPRGILVNEVPAQGGSEATPITPGCEATPLGIPFLSMIRSIARQSATIPPCLLLVSSERASSTWDSMWPPAEKLETTFKLVTSHVESPS